MNKTTHRRLDGKLTTTTVHREVECMWQTELSRDAAHDMSSPPTRNTFLCHRLIDHPKGAGAEVSSQPPSSSDGRGRADGAGRRRKRPEGRLEGLAEGGGR